MPHPPVTTTPTPAFGNRPAASGDAFDYAGTMTETFVRPPLPDGAITPSPNPESSQTITTAVTQAVTVTVAASPFDSVANPYDFHTVETDTENGGLETSTVTSDGYYHYVTSGAATDVDYLGGVTTDSDGVTFTTKIGTGNGLVDVVPEPSGALSPANNASALTTELDPDGSTLQRSTAANGTYTESGSNPDGTTVRAVADADGSGSYTFPLIIPAESMYTVSPPEPVASGSGNEIKIALSLPDELVNPAPSPSATPFVIAGAVDVWYPQPLVLSAQSLQNTGAVTPPSKCGVASPFEKSANRIVQTTSTVDPVFGEIDINTVQTYTENHVGVVCVVLSDVVTQYYDLSGQTQEPTELPVSFASSPFQITTTTETLGITNETIEISALRREADAIGVRAATEPFRAVLAHNRALRRAAFIRSARARTNTVLSSLRAQGDLR